MNTFSQMTPTRKLSIIAGCSALISSILEIWHIPFTQEITQTLQALVSFASVALGINTVIKESK